MNRMIYSLLISFVVALILGPILIPMLRRLKFGQSIREEGPKSHIKKTGTPVMGGFIFILSTFITMFIVIKNPSDKSMIPLYAFLAFGSVGFLDDILKILHKKNLGLRAYQKMLLLLIVSVSLSYYGAKSSEVGTSILVPFLKSSWNLGKWYIPLAIVYFAATTNAVNLTDGLDGLASCVTILVMTFFALVSFSMGEYTIAIFCSIVVGGLLGFLKYNAFPAQTFMGDTGSLALGGAVATVAMMLKLPLIVIIVGGIYVIEALSVIIQVTSFKLTGKRVFKMSPIHHHFELSGWHETKVVVMFSIITTILCLIAFLSLPKL
ncbi:phospho-N-acetylmuramoyl-pentapeptide-transferase [Haloimpatiens sp. FM7315]|uniref:phospho-N-acetylmuramoyl-pentapeptide- transferase n=1 Tax=Haloimpatiens sp. FM7315 TaxID=3298609 RepID=UPI00370BCCB0